MINPNDPRTHITHESFGVAPELVGLPLASPWRRLAGIFADLIPVAILSGAGLFVFLAFTSFVVVWRALSGLGGSSNLRRGAASPIRFIASTTAFVIVLRIGGVFDSIGNRGSDNDDDASADNVVEMGSVTIDFGDESVQRDVAEIFEDMGITQPTEDQVESVRELVEDKRELEQDLSRAREEGGGIMRWFANALDDLGIGFGWGALYFTTFTVLGNGQTPGKRLVGIRVIRLDGRPVGWWLSFERFGSYFASFSTGLLGFAQIFWDRNRQALHDKAVETVVIRMGSRDVYERLNAARR